MTSSSQSDLDLQRIDHLLDRGEVRRTPRSRIESKPRAKAPAEEFAGGRRGTKLEVIRAPSWAADSRLDWLVHGFSTRVGGLTRIYRGENGCSDLNLGLTAEDDPVIVAANRKLFLKAICGEEEDFSLATLRQIHSTLMRRVTRRKPWPAPAILKGDGLMTGSAGLLLGIQTADCLPVLLADTRHRAVAAFHAGWRGTLARIVENGVGRMRLEFGSRPKDMVAAIGPGIGQCCYAVGEEIRHQFESQFSYAGELFREVSDSGPIRQRYPLLFLTARAPGHSNLGPSLHLDLAEANRRQLISAGLSPGAISLTGECTGCQTNRFFSHRSEQGFTGRMMSVIGLRP